MSANDLASPERPMKATLCVLLALGLALAGAALAPSAAALCVHANPENAGIVVVQAGDCATYVQVLGEQVLP